VTWGQESFLSNSAEELKLNAVTVCEDRIVIFKRMFLMERWVGAEDEYWWAHLKGWNFLLSWESWNIFVKLTWRLKLCKHVKVFSQYAVHDYHIREAETLRFLALIDACLWAKTLKELQGHIHNMSTGNFLLLRNALPLPHLKPGNISSIAHLNKQTRPKSVLSVIWAIFKTDSQDGLAPTPSINSTG